MSTLVGINLAGRYRLDARIASGGMSTVYRAFDRTLERTVAIKVMHREIAQDSDQLERFRREARAVAQLSHPHVVGVIDAGEEDGRPFIVFEHVEGETLKQRIRSHGPLEVGEAVAYAIEVARALGAAHQRHIVHRDVKPQNVLIDVEGRAKVTDFGIARTLEEDGLTADGRVIGTTDYVAPEQAVGHDVTGRSDIYSLGIVLYEMLTGEVPFKGESQVAVAMAHVREPMPDVRARRPEVSAALAAVIERATAKEPGDRQRDAAELVAALEETLALEASRAGQATGEATMVLRTLPQSARRRIPWSVRAPAWTPLLLIALAAALVAGAILISQNASRGTKGKVTASGLSQVPLEQSAARDYDPPPGDGHEHSDQTSRVLDGDTSTAWSTETYDGGFGAKPGVGLALDAAPGLAARALSLRTPTPGFTAAVYAANGAQMPAGIGGWTRLTQPRQVAARTQFRFGTGGREYRWYLLWISELPPGSGKASVSEIGLFR
ncbi:MAG: protein kinase [Solirubrobacteraceae bacterium]